ncbi:MAG: RDD family protein [Streptosporangiaceae bacterium]
MSSMPERDAAGQWTGGTQQSSREWVGTSGQRDTPGQEQFGGPPPGGTPQGGRTPDDPYGSYHGRPGGWQSPVSRDETQVVGRRVVQYVIDYILAGIIPGLAYWLLDRGSGFLHGFGWALATLIALVVYLWYWVLRPNSHHGQTFGMQLLGVRVISKDGGPASMVQYFVRGVMLIIDTLFFGLVGLITMMASRYHQRAGDHLARTLVVGAGYGASASPDGRQFQRTDAAAADERLASPDMYAEDRYGQGSTPDSGLGGPGAPGRDHL